MYGNTVRNQSLRERTEKVDVRRMRYVDEDTQGSRPSSGWDGALVQGYGREANSFKCRITVCGSVGYSKG